MSMLFKNGNVQDAIRVVALGKLRCLGAVFDTTLHKSYDDIAKDAMNLKIKQLDTRQYDRDQIVFIDKGIKDFSMAEVQKLLEMDTKYQNVKFKLVSDSLELREASINPDFRRLLNNGLYYGIYMNSPQLCTKYLADLSIGPKSVKLKTVSEQVYLSESPNNRGSSKFIEFPNFQTFHYPITINGKKYNLATPSISILIRLKGIGIPSNHPDYQSLSSIDSIPNPLNESETIPLITIPDSKSSDLTALIPSHILAHQKYIPTNRNAIPGPIEYDGHTFSHADLSTHLIRKHNLKAQLSSMNLFEVVPYIAQKHITDSSSSFTKTVNSKEVLNRDSFPSIPSIAQAPLRIWTSRSLETPLSFIPSTYVRKCLDYRKAYQIKIFRGVSLPKIMMTSDILRSVVLFNGTTSNWMFEDRRYCLMILTGVMEVAGTRYRWMDKPVGISEQVEDVSNGKELESEDGSEKTVYETVEVIDLDDKEQSVSNLQEPEKTVEVIDLDEKEQSVSNLQEPEKNDGVEEEVDRYELKFRWDLKMLVKEEGALVHDMFLVKSFYDVCQGKLLLGDFSSILMDYIIVDRLVRRSQQGERVKNPVLGNVLLRLLKDQLSYHFPEFSNYYLSRLNFKSIETFVPDGVSEKLNKWQNNITYPVEFFSFSEPVFESVTVMIASLNKHTLFPFPYTQSLLVMTSGFMKDPVKQYASLINSASRELVGRDALINPEKEQINGLLIGEEMYRQRFTDDTNAGVLKSPQHRSRVLNQKYYMKELRLQACWDIKSMREDEAYIRGWVSRLKPMRFLEENSFLLKTTDEDGEMAHIGDDGKEIRSKHILGLFKRKFREYIEKDLDENVAVVIKQELAREGLPGNQLEKKIHKAKDLVNRLRKTIDNEFIARFIKIYQEKDTIPENIEPVEDIEEIVNEFKQVL